MGWGSLHVSSKLLNLVFARGSSWVNAGKEHFWVLTEMVPLQTNISGYPWPVTAPLGLYPEYPLDALPHLDYGVRKAVADALFK